MGFALALPMLSVLLLGIADFGRVFHAELVTGPAARRALFNLNIVADY